jgi:glycerophosphoryl diester phosphodiesterase
MLISKKWYSELKASDVRAAAAREGDLQAALTRVVHAMEHYDGDLEQLQTRSFLCSIDAFQVDVEALVGATEMVHDLDAWFIAHDLLILRMHLVTAYSCRELVDAAFKFYATELVSQSSRWTALTALEFSVLASWATDYGDLSVISKLSKIHSKLSADAARETRPLLRGVSLACGDKESYRQKSLVTVSESDRGFEDYVSGKTVAIVGPVNTGTKNGEEIDSFDVVVRFNHHDKAEYRADLFGARTDVSYYTDPAFKKVVLGTNSTLSDLAYAVPQKAEVVSQLEGSSSIQAKLRSAYRQSNSVFFKSHGNALQRLLFDLLRFQVGEVKAFNMDMWLSSHDKNYKARRPKMDPHMFIHHDLISNFRFTKHVVAHGALNVDKTLAKILLNKPQDYMLRLELLHGEHFRETQLKSAA